MCGANSIVESPEDAYRCFMRTDMDYLVIGNFIFDKKKATCLARKRQLETGICIGLIFLRMDFLKDLWGFITARKKWWLMPLIIILLLIGVLIVLGGTSIAPFIYTLF